MNILISMMVGLVTSGFLGALIGAGGSVLGSLLGHGDEKNLLKSQKALTDASMLNMNQEESGKNALIQSLTGYHAATPTTNGYMDTASGTWVNPDSPAGKIAKARGTLKDMASTSDRTGSEAGSGGVAGFYDQYMQNGSPFLKSIQRSSAEQINKQYGEEIGKSRLNAAQNGFGYAPSGIQSAIESSLGRARAQSTSEAYLNNLLQNEQVKFQAAGAKGDVLQKAAGLYSPENFGSIASKNMSVTQPGNSSTANILNAGSSLLSSFLNKPKNPMNLQLPQNTPSFGGSLMSSLKPQQAPAINI